MNPQMTRCGGTTVNEREYMLVTGLTYLRTAETALRAAILSDDDDDLDQRRRVLVGQLRGLVEGIEKVVRDEKLIRDDNDEREFLRDE